MPSNYHQLGSKGGREEGREGERVGGKRERKKPTETKREDKMSGLKHKTNLGINLE